MATRVVPTSFDADNSAGSCTLAACNDWRSGVRRFHVGTSHHELTSDAGYTTAGSPSLPPLSINLFLCRGSPYTRLGTRRLPRSLLEVRLLLRRVCSFEKWLHMRLAADTAYLSPRE